MLYLEFQNIALKPRCVQAVVLKPAFIYGDRKVKLTGPNGRERTVNLPLQQLGAPLARITSTELGKRIAGAGSRGYRRRNIVKNNTFHSIVLQFLCSILIHFLDLGRLEALDVYISWFPQKCGSVHQRLRYSDVTPKRSAASTARNRKILGFARPMEITDESREEQTRKSQAGGQVRLFWGWGGMFNTFRSFPVTAAGDNAQSRHLSSVRGLMWHHFCRFGAAPCGFGVDAAA